MADYLFKYDKRESRCKCILKLLNGHSDAKAVLDSGAFLSAMSLRTYCRITGADMRFIKSFLEKNGTSTSVASYDIDSTKAYYCYIRNCIIAGQEFGRFNFVLTLGNSDSVLLGMDFMQSFDNVEYANSRVIENDLIIKDIRLSKFNRDMYEKYFTVWRKGSDAIELNLLSKNIKISLGDGLSNSLSVF